MVICYKKRLKANEIADMRIIGDVEGKDVLLVDDIVDTAGKAQARRRLKILACPSRWTLKMKFTRIFYGKELPYRLKRIYP